MRTACNLWLVVVAGVACAGPSTFPVTTPTVSPSAAVATSAAASTTPTGVAATTPPSSPILRFALTDVRTGESFTLGGFTGKTVIVQGMAVW